MRDTTRQDWHRRVDGVIRAMLANLDERQELERLASLAAASPWHFHRTFRELTGESLEACLRRLRLERASARLRERGARVIDVALDSGYESPEAFAKAFRRAYGLSPSAAMRLPHWEGKLPSDSGIHYEASGEERWFFIRPDKEGSMETKIVEMPPRRLFGIFAMDDPWKLPEAWSRLHPIAGESGLAARARVWLSAFLDGEPGIDPEGKKGNRYMAAFQAPDGAACPPGLSELEMPGGLYAVVVHFGSTEEIGITVDRWFKEWLPSSSWRADFSRPSYEWYQNFGLPNELLLTFWCTPVAKREA
jgi:AraC family transcriptional regulator